MNAPRRALAAFVLVLAAALWAPPALAEPFIAVMRHALAPGFGDPPGFKVDDCATQRNLNDVGRGQAKTTGKAIRARGIAKARVISSQWCRCQETARLLGLGPVETMPALNSLHGRPENRAAQMAALAAFLKDLAAKPDAEPVVLVTHHTVVLELTGRGPASGEVFLLKLDPAGKPTVVGNILTKD